MYEKYIKRVIDIVLAFIAFIMLAPLLILLTVIGVFVFGGDPFFVQKRPGMTDKKTGQEKLFYLYKFRSMTYDTDNNGKLLPDDERLISYGRFLRRTSLDELPSLLNIISGQLSIVGPRPQLVKDMVFMSTEQRRRHTVRPGLTGLAQVNGRNDISWEEKFKYDLQYIDNGISFVNDIKIIFKTVGKVISCEGADDGKKQMPDDFGDYLLRMGKISREEYDAKHRLAEEYSN